MRLKSFFEKIRGKPVHTGLGVFGVGFCSFVWLVVIVPFLSLHNNGVEPFFSPKNKGNQDFAHYYMGGAILLEGAFESLYPEPNESIESNIGWPGSSTPKPLYDSIARERGVENSFRYILTPPTTLLLAPLAVLPYPVARCVWIMLLGLCCWGVCFLSFQMGIRHGLPRLGGLFWWMVWAFSPLMLKTVRTANSTPLVAFSLGLGAWGIFRNKRVLAISSCIVAGLLKGTSLVFAPFVFCMKRWGIVVWGVVAVVAINLLMLSLAGVEVYREFFEVVYPSTKIPDPFLGNQSFYGFFYRLGGNAGIRPDVLLGIKSIGILAMGGLLSRLWLIRRRVANDFALFIAAVVGVLGVYLVFGAYCWDHYVLFYLPFWFVLFGHVQGGWKKVALLGFAGLVWLPLTVVRGGAFLAGEPLQSHMLWGQLLLIAVAVAVVFAREGSVVHEG